MVADQPIGRTQSQPSPRDESSLTQLLSAWRNGAPGALDTLMERVHPELRRIATRHFRAEKGGHTLEPAALVNEAYLRLARGIDVDWRDRRHFFAVVSGIMRNLLVDHARARRAKKRQRTDVEFPSPGPRDAAAPVDMLDLDNALSLLERRHPAHARLVQLRFFGGLTVPEAAVELGIARATAERAWTFARAWLFREMTRPAPPQERPQQQSRTDPE
jgi:RNA polymerase sigma-70 factor (ECF subfamily)